MINVRRGVFETNSSSMHSLVVVRNPKPYNSRELQLDHYPSESCFELFSCVDNPSFCRAPFQVLRSPVEKLRYYSAYYLGNEERYELIPKITGFISERTGVEPSKIDLTSHHGYDDGFGYVESNDTGDDPMAYVEEHNITMEEFVLNPKYVVIVDGDEYEEFKKLFESNILNAEDFEDITSGADFWNDSVKEIFVNWFGSDRRNDSSKDFELIDDVNSFTKVLCFLIGSDSIKFYDDERIRELVRLAKERNPNLKVILRKDRFSRKWNNPTMGNHDTSMFDEVDLNSEF